MGKICWIAGGGTIIIRTIADLCYQDIFLPQTYTYWFQNTLLVLLYAWLDYVPQLVPTILRGGVIIKKRENCGLFPNRLDPPPFRIFQTFLNFRLI